ncbi:endonuclease/exonuclease/phosphatase family protein [Ichthyobacterium seriolicida]|uniref:Endonuclease n=1 Tax=Ichthyobacterium seriolicida TaxID=242600 RepID=A0A1J1DWA7_9FLAO|nr:endonuclease/exonuclease/phosphatase family protein [Ichthyobacterium seriolicida]BAV94146.1 endonuclease [Ichthyobacterium seriolicida]
MINKKGGEYMLYIINIFFSFLLILVYINSYVPPDLIPYHGILSVIYPFLLLVNIAFALIWISRLNPLFLISTIVIFLGYKNFDLLFKFPKNSEVYKKVEGDIKLISFNVHSFNRYNWIQKKDVIDEIKNFISVNDPDIICFQEFYDTKKNYFPEYPYVYISSTHKNEIWGNAIFSKFPIIEKGIIKFENSYNQTTYVSIDIGQEILRIYNVHLESLGIDQEDYEYRKKHKKNTLERLSKLFKNVNKGFSKHSEQSVLIREHIDNSPYKNIVCGDFNSTAFFYEYKKIKGGLNDAFSVFGQGLGATFFFYYYPLRIDFILSDPRISIKEFQTHSNIRLSDHIPLSLIFN